MPPLLRHLRHRYSKISSPVIRVINNVAQLGPPKPGPKPRQLLSLPPFPAHPLPGKKDPIIEEESSRGMTAISWVKYYFDEVEDKLVQTHFNKGLVQMESPASDDTLSTKNRHAKLMKKIKPNEVMEPGARIHIPVSIAESRISRRFDTIPSGTLYPNADEIKYMQRLVRYKDSAIIVLNKPPKLPVKGGLTVHNSMDALAAAALSYDYEEGPKLIHRLDRETSGLLIMGRTSKSTSHMQWLFGNDDNTKASCKEWNEVSRATCMRYWALVIGSPKEKEGIICAPLMKVLLDDGKTERVMLAHRSGFDASYAAITEYRVLGPMINGCSWVELQPHTSRKHQLRVHCAEALGTPIIGDYKYGWFVQKSWKHTPPVNIEPTSGEPYKLRRPDGLDVQKGSVLSKVPLLHLHCRELVLPNVAKFLNVIDTKNHPGDSVRLNGKPDILRFVAPMPSHMKISWNLMSSYLV